MIMNKKVLGILIGIVTIILSSVVISAQQETIQETIDYIATAKVISIYYDIHHNQHYATAIDKNQGLWILELGSSKIYNKLQNKIIIMEIHDYNNLYLYDDEIIKWQVK